MFDWEYDYDVVSGFGGTYSFNVDSDVTEVDEVVVTASRPTQPYEPVWIDPVPDIVLDPTVFDPLLPGGVGDVNWVFPDECADRQALDFQSAVSRESDRNSNEHGALIYRDANGQMQRSDLIQGQGGRITQQAILAEFNRLGISWSQVVGFAHTHPAGIFGGSSDEARVNRYPSGGAVSGGDWTAAGWMVGLGAGAGGQDFSMYVVDPYGVMREFDYSMRSHYEQMDENDRRRGEDLPNPLVSDGSVCGGG